MVIEIRARNPIARAIICVAAILAFALMLPTGLHRFVVGTLADVRLEYQEAADDLQAQNSPRIDSATLAEGLERYPDSSRLQYRLAEAEFLGHEQDQAVMEAHAIKAVSLSPYDYKPRELLASIQEARGDRLAAEKSLRAAVALAPNYVDTHWRLANLLLRTGNLDESGDEFQKAITEGSSLLPITLELLWRSSKGDAARLRPLINDDQARIEFAEFLLNHQRVDEAVDVFGHIDRSTKLSSARTSGFLTALITAGDFEFAKKAWIGLIGDNTGGEAQDSVIWNGGFESDILVNYTQFDWTVAPTDYAKLSIDSGTAHSGKRSLRIDFAGRDTTKLDSEIKQVIVARPATAYRLQWYVKTEALATPEGPRVEISIAPGGQIVTLSSPVGSGSTDWHQMTVDFVSPTAPTGSVALYLKIVRKPEFSYDDPTQGTVWFDDFTSKELVKNR
jgi:tetratricopeptide (TPR) repeat protein